MNTIETAAKPIGYSLPPSDMPDVAHTIDKLRPYVVRQCVHVSGHRNNGTYFGGELMAIDWNLQRIEVVEDTDSTFINIGDIRDFHHSQLNRDVVAPAK